MKDQLLDFLNADKKLPFAPGWATEAGREFARLVSPIDVDGVTMEGARFGASAHLYRPDQRVSFRLEMIVTSVSNTYTPLARFDWLPMAAHNNRGRGPDHLKFIQFDETHLHPYEWNWVKGEPLKGNMPVAVPIDASLPKYQDALDFIEKLFKIKGVSRLPIPPWTSKLV